MMLTAYRKIPQNLRTILEVICAIGLMMLVSRTRDTLFGRSMSMIMLLAGLAYVIYSIRTRILYKKGRLGKKLLIRRYNDSAAITGLAVFGSLAVTFGLGIGYAENYHSFSTIQVALYGALAIAGAITYLPGARISVKDGRLILPGWKIELGIQDLHEAGIHNDRIDFTDMNGQKHTVDSLEIKLREIPDILDYFKRHIPRMETHVHILAV